MSSKGISMRGISKLSKKLEKNGKLTAVQQSVKKHTNNLESHTKDLEMRVYVKGYSKGNTVKQTHLDIQGNGLEGIVGMVMPYDSYLETGTRYMDAEQALKPAYEYEAPRFVADIKKIMG